VVGSLDKHIPNDKEPIRPRRLGLRRELPEPGAHNFACGANYHIPVWFNFGVPRFLILEANVP